MDFRFTKEEEEFRQEVDEFIRREVTEEIINETEWRYIGPHTWEFCRKLGEKGWLCPQWPKEYGGLNSEYIKRFIIRERINYHRAQINLDGAGMIGDVILTYGSEEQKKEYLLKIAKGEIEFALGYTEPDAGTDLASVQTRAVRQGDEYIINGHKLYNTRCHYAQYHWLLARTDTEAPKHRGLSLFIVDLKSPGITIRPLQALGGWRTNEVFYDDVHIPAENLVGEENRGFYQMMVALERERTEVAFSFSYERFMEELIEYCRHTENDGISISKDPLVRQKIAQMKIEYIIICLLRWHAMWVLSREEKPTRESAMVKVFGTEAYHRMLNEGLQILGLYGQLEKDSNLAPLRGAMEQEYQASIIGLIGAGSNEILRNVLAERELGLPRA